MFSWYMVTYFIGFPLAAYIFLPVFYELKQPSVYKVWCRAVISTAKALVFRATVLVRLPNGRLAHFLYSGKRKRFISWTLWQ